MRPVSVWIAAVALVVLGIFSFWRLPLSLLPTLERPRLDIAMKDADRSRSELLQELVIPLERRLQTLDGVVDVLATLTDGEAVVTLQTEWQTDVDRLRIEAERRLVEVSSASLDELVVGLDTGETEPILQVAVLGGRAHQRTELAEKVLVPELGRLPGAGELKVFGSSHRRVVIEPRAADLAVRGLTAADLASTLSTVGRNEPLGRIRQGAELRPLIVRRDVASLESLQRLPLPSGDDLLQLQDVADVTLQDVPDHGLFRYDGQDGLLIEVYRAPGANAVQLARAGRQVVDELAQRTERLQVRLVADRSVEVVDSLRHLGEAGLLGLLLGTLVLRFMLGSWRPTLALAVVVPVSIVAAFSAFYLFGVSLDIVSLAGLALAAGMLVDNSIVVLESIASTAEQGAENPVEEGTRQIAMPLVAGFLTTAVVFLPLIYLKGLARAFFGVQAFAIVSTLLISLALSLTLTPILSRRSGSKAGRSPGRGAYERLLDALTRRPGIWALVLVMLMACAAAITLPLLQAELLPSGAPSGVGVEIHLPKGLTLNEASRRLRVLEDKLSTDDNLLHLSSTYRGRADGRRHLGAETAGATFELELKDREESLETAQQARRVVAKIPGLEGSVEARRGAVTSVVERGSRGLRLELAAGSPARLDALVDQVRRTLADGGVAARVVLRDQGTPTGPAATEPAWALSWDPIQLTLLGVSEDTMRRQLGYALGGLEIGKSAIEGTEPEIRLQPTNTGPLEQTPLKPVAGDDKWVPLGAVAEVQQVWQPPATERRNGRLVRLLATDEGLGEAERIESLLRAVPLGPDQQVQLAGEVRETRRSFEQLRLALVLALLLVFLTVAALYESLTMPLVVMVTVPVAAIGGLVALACTGQSLNVMSFLGLILLSGIVVNNAIVLVHRAEQLLEDGPSVRHALRQAASERYRPILMTTVTTLLGMIPLALLGGEGLELRRALATTVSGGLVTSWIAALLLVPALYLVIGRRAPELGGDGE